jgi:alpha-L-arabinofuranosidase
MIHRIALPIMAVLLMAVSVSKAQDKILDIEASKPLYPVPTDLWGLFFEDINFAADGGLYAEMVKNRSFEFFKPLMGWKNVEENSKGSVQILSRTGEQNPRYIRLIKPSGPGRFGIVNEGFRGMYAREGNRYYFSMLARMEKGTNPAVHVELTDSNNVVIGRTQISNIGSEWKKYEGTIAAGATSLKSRLRIMLADQAAVDIDMVSLFPADTWKGRKGGLRADLVQMLADLKPGFLRFPGGCIVEGHDLAVRYQWKKTVGPVENREMIVNRWNYEFPHRSAPDYYQSFGLGFYEYFLLSEDLGAEPLPIINCGMACQYNSCELVPLDELEPYIQDALDLIEFANGPVTSQWGRLRSEMGHPEPFNLKYLGVGNEQWGPQYVERLEIFMDRILKVYPDILLVGGSGPAPDGADFNHLWGEMKRLNVPLVDEHYYRPPQWFLSNAGRYDSYDRQGPKVFAGEYAAHSSRQSDQPESRNNWESALAEAAFLTGIERNADVVRLASYAPLFGHVDGWQWRPDLIWFDNHRSMATPNYYVQQMYSIHKGTHVLSALYQGQPLAGQDSLYASAVYDENTKEVIVKIANAGMKPGSVAVNLSGKKAVSGETTSWVIRHEDPAAFNSLTHPGNVAPAERKLQISRGKTAIPVEGRSFSVTRIPVK